MKSILEFLFSSEITFPGSRREEHQLGEELDAVVKLRSRIGAMVQQEQPGLWEVYQAKARALHSRDCQAEFERGFLTAAGLALEVFYRARDMEG